VIFFAMTAIRSYIRGSGWAGIEEKESLTIDPISGA